MPHWTTTIVAPPLTVAANQSFGVFPRRRELSITRVGAYTRIVLTKRVQAQAMPAAPRWA
jgi:hypothetical protein